MAVSAVLYSPETRPLQQLNVGKQAPKNYACSARMRSMMSWMIAMPMGEATGPGRRLWKNCAEIMNADLVRIHVKQLQQEVQDHCKL
jgi:hypothetical protein